MTKSVWYVLKSLVWAQPCICTLLQWQQAFCLWNLTKKRPKWFTHNFYSFEVAPKQTTDFCSMTSWLQNITKSVWYVLKSLVCAQPCICTLLQWQQAFCLWNLTKKRPIWFTHNFYSFEVAPKLTTDSCKMTYCLQNLTKSVWYVLKSLVWAQPCICTLLQWQQAFCLWNLTKKRPIWFTHNFYSFEVAPKLTTYSCNMSSFLQNMTKSVWYVLKSLVWGQPCICPLLQWQQAFCLLNLTKKCPKWLTHNFYSFEVAPKLTTGSSSMTSWLQNMTKSVWYVLKSLVWAQPCICTLLQWQQAFCLWNLTKKPPKWFTHNF